MKNRFIENELWYLTIAGAFQRNNIYAKGRVSNGLERQLFKTKLRNSVIAISEHYNNPVSDNEHLDNIRRLILDNGSNILENGALNFGSAQKLLNLYLKYLWCTDRLGIPPPHCPIDSTILQKTVEHRNVRWTQITSEADYMKYINSLRDIASLNSVSLAEWELNAFKS